MKKLMGLFLGLMIMSNFAAAESKILQCTLLVAQPAVTINGIPTPTFPVNNNVVTLLEGKDSLLLIHLKMLHTY